MEFKTARRKTGYVRKRRVVDIESGMRVEPYFAEAQGDDYGVTDHGRPVSMAHGLPSFLHGIEWQHLLQTAEMKIDIAARRLEAVHIGVEGPVIFQSPEEFVEDGGCGIVVDAVAGNSIEDRTVHEFPHRHPEFRARQVTFHVAGKTGADCEY